MSTVAFKTNFSQNALSSLVQKESKFEKLSSELKGTDKPGGLDFGAMLKEGIKSVDAAHKKADVMADNIATGKETNLHETMLAASQAELGFNLMVQLRNKGLEAYQEIMRMHV